MLPDSGTTILDLGTIYPKKEDSEFPNALPDSLQAFFKPLINAYCRARWPNNKLHYYLREAWSEDDIIAFNVEHYHCSSCANDWENFYVHRFPLVLFEGPDPLTAIVAIAEQELAAEQALKQRQKAWEVSARERGEIRLMRKLMEKYPEYINGLQPLPEIGDEPIPHNKDIYALLSYKRDEP